MAQTPKRSLTPVGTGGGSMMQGGGSVHGDGGGQPYSTRFVGAGASSLNTKPSTSAGGFGAPKMTPRKNRFNNPYKV